MNIDDIRQKRMHNQRLVGAPFDHPEEMVRWHGAVQAQDYAGAKWGIAQRCQDVSNAALDRLFDEGKIVRTHIMRPTWHFVAPEDIRWMQELTAPRVHARNRTRYRELEIDETVAARSQSLIEKALQGGKTLTRAELGEALHDGGIEASGQRLGYLMMYAELDALICSGPRKGKQLTYALLNERVPSTTPLHRDEALAELTRRYFTSHGPATPHDLSWWSGLTVAEARNGLALIDDELEHETIDGATWWFAPSSSTPAIRPPVVHLLPSFDEYFIGFRNHEPTFEPSIREAYNTSREYWAAHFIALNGIIVGGWRRNIGKGEVTITTMLPMEFDDAERTALESAAEEYGRFLGLPVAFEQEASPGE